MRLAYHNYDSITLNGGVVEFRIGGNLTRFIDAEDIVSVDSASLHKLLVHLRSRKEPLAFNEADATKMGLASLSALSQEFRDAEISVAGVGGPAGTVTSVNGEAGPTVVIDGSDVDSTHASNNYTVSSTSVDGHLIGIDNALGSLTDIEVVSGAVVATDIVLTMSDASTVIIDATSLLADVKLSSGVYNSTTEELDLTLSDSTLISIPVAALLPVTTDDTIDGNGSSIPLTITPSADSSNALVTGSDGKLYVDTITTMVGTNDITAGTEGVVPIAPVGSLNKQLKGDGTFGEALSPWVAGVSYTLGNTVHESDKIYYCTVTHISGAAFSGDSANWQELSFTEEGLRGNPVADNTELTSLVARNYERRLVLADSKEYVFELGATMGTLADDLATGFWQEEIPAGAITTYIDASGGAVTENLDVSTGSGLIRFFTNLDITNTATLAVASGDTLNGVVDGTFEFSDFAGNTMFRADEVPGGWIINDVQATSTVSSRVGEFFYAKSGSTVQGYLPVVSGTVANGAVMYPVWAAMYPEFVSGNDIVFPADVDGMFLRNIGGLATTEGTFQADATAPNGMSTNTAGAHTHSYTTYPATRQAANDFTGVQARHSTGSANTSSAGNHSHSIVGGGPETRPNNRAYQLYTIVDDYNEFTLIGLVKPQAMGREQVFDVTSITATGTTLSYNAGADPANAGTILNNGTILRIGSQAKIAFDFHCDDDDAIVLDLSAALPVGARITSLNGVADTPTEDPHADVGFTSPSDTTIRINRSDSIDADLFYRLTIWVEGYPLFEESTVIGADEFPITNVATALNGEILIANGDGTGTFNTLTIPLDDDVETVTGSAVDNTDPRNPIINLQTIVSGDANNSLSSGSDLGAYLDSLSLAADLDLTTNILTLRDGSGNVLGTGVDISPYLDDTNLARLVSGSLDGGTGIATFTRDDASTFTVDFSSFLSDLAFTGATSLAAGTQGDVPAPAAGDQDKYLKGDGTWGEITVLTDVETNATSNNVAINWKEHTRTTTAAASDTVTIQATSAASVGDTLEFYNASGNQLTLVIDGGDSYLGTPSADIPAESGFTARIVAANTIEVVGTGLANGGSSLHYASYYIQSTSNQSISTIGTQVGSGYEVLNLDATNSISRNEDLNGLYTADRAFTIQNAGTYRLFLNVSFDQQSSNTHPSIFINGVKEAGANDQDSNLGSDSSSIEIIKQLAAGDKVEFGSPNTLSGQAFQYSISVQQLPDATLVDPSLLVPETLEYAEIAKSSNQNTVIGGSINDVADLEYTVSNTGKYEISYTIQVIGGEIQGSALDIFLRDGLGNEIGGRARYQHNTVDSSDTVGEQIYGTSIIDLLSGDTVKVSYSQAGGNIQTLGASTNQSRLFIKQLATSSVINAEDLVVDDQTSSGYFDFGNMRMQWGRATTDGTGAVTITYPAPMSSTGTYSLVATAANGSNVAMMYLNDTTTGAQIIARNDTGGPVITSFSWQVIGSKP